MTQKLYEKIDRLSDVAKAKLAAEILNETTPTEEVFKTFFDELSLIAHSQLLDSAEEEQYRS